MVMVSFTFIKEKAIIYMMDRMSISGTNNVYYFWSYYYFPLVCPSLRRN